MHVYLVSDLLRYECYNIQDVDPLSWGDKELVTFSVNSGDPKNLVLEVCNCANSTTHSQKGLAIEPGVMYGIGRKRNQKYKPP